MPKAKKKPTKDRLKRRRRPRQGKYQVVNKAKYKGDVDNVVYRSSWELRAFRYCDKHTGVLQWASEPFPIRYHLIEADASGNAVRKPHRYFPDLWMRVRTKNGETKTYLVEIKPKKQTKAPEVPKRKTKRYLTEVLTWNKNQKKWEAAREMCRKKGWEFLIWTEDELNIRR